MASKNLHGASGRGDVLNFEPEKITVITDRNHPLYDPRSEKPVNEGLIISIMRIGVLQPLVIAPDGGDGAVVIDGHQRRAAAIEANKRLKAKGAKPVLVPCVWRRGKDVKLFEAKVAANAIREWDNLLEEAEKMQHLFNMGYDEEDVAASFGKDVQTVRNRIALLDCDKSVQNAVVSGKVSASIAGKLSKKSKVEQKELLSEMVEKGATKGRKAEQAIKGEKRELKPVTPKARERAKTALFDYAEASSGRTSEFALLIASVIERLDGHVGALDAHPALAEVFNEAVKTKKEKAIEEEADE